MYAPSHSICEKGLAHMYVDITKICQETSVMKCGVISTIVTIHLSIVSINNISCSSDYNWRKFPDIQRGIM